MLTKQKLLSAIKYTLITKENQFLLFIWFYGFYSTEFIIACQMDKRNNAPNHMAFSEKCNRLKHRFDFVADSKFKFVALGPIKSLVK